MQNKIDKISFEIDLKVLFAIKKNMHFIFCNVLTLFFNKSLIKSENIQKNITVLLFYVKNKK